jgi:hypothetical protein
MKSNRLCEVASGRCTSNEHSVDPMPTMSRRCIRDALETLKTYKTDISM